ncbi:hypothetical protein BY458DRAFT_477474 [Sporodiniella umbellata]|nr:hypothetical protein BY458DRAFT_477474 [Sporodiniella umbellata]
MNQDEKQLNDKKPEELKRPPHPRAFPSNSSYASTDEEESHAVPLETLAGPALILPETVDIDGRTLREEFDWSAKDEDEDVAHEPAKEGALTQNGMFICLSKHSEPIAWTCIFLFALIFIAIDVAVFVVYRQRDHVSLISHGLQLWFTWFAFVWCIGAISQLFVEVLPWIVKKIVGWLRPQSTEVLRMRLSYYMALRTYIKLILISSWAWGAWALIRQHIQLPYLGQDENGLDIYQSEPTYVSIFYSVWEACFFASIFLFIEKFILQLIVTSFHKKAYGDRVKDNDKALRTLDRLKKAKRYNAQEFLMKRILRKQNKATPNTSGESTPKQSIMSPPYENAPKTNVKFPQNLETLNAIPPIDLRDSEKTKQEGAVDDEKKPKKNFLEKFKASPKKNKHESSGSSDDEKERPSISRENTWFSRTGSHDNIFSATRDFGANTLNATRDFGISTSQIPGKLLKDGYQKITERTHNPDSNQKAKSLARKIYTNLMGPDPQRDFLVEADLYPYFRTVQEASDAFKLFDLDGNGDITKKELRSGCVRIYRERKNLSRSMRDLSQATGKLDIILMIIFTLIWVIIVCSAFGVNVGTELMPLWSAFIAASFVFGGSAKDAFEAIIFVFVTHPFDAGDRVYVSGENWVVSEVGLLVTTFIKWDGTIVYVKNSVLTTQYIYNVRRSGRTGETNELQIDFATPSAKIRQLVDHMVQWSNQFPKLYTPNSACCNVLSFQNQNAISISFYFEHSKNWQDPGGRWLRHNNFMYELKEECERLEIDYSLPTQPFESAPGDAPPELYNMGKKSSYGLEGMVKRRPYEDDEDSHQNLASDSPHAAPNTGHSASSNAGESAGQASAMMFASNMM